MNLEYSNKFLSNPLIEILGIDSGGVNKLGKRMRKFIRWYWFMENGLYSASYWKWRRILCLFGVHSWSKQYASKVRCIRIINLDDMNLDIRISCERCNYMYIFELRSNDLFFQLASLIEVRTQSDIDYHSTYEPSNYEKQKSIDNFIKIMQKCIDRLAT